MMVYLLPQEFPAVQRLLPVRQLPQIRLDRAMLGTASRVASAGNFGEVELHNNSQQSHYLVIRGATFGPAAAMPVQLTPVQKVIGSAAFTSVAPLLPDRAILPGEIRAQLFASLETPSVFVFYLQSQAQSTSDQWPIYVIPPTWSVRFESQVANQAFTASILWEALTPEEFVESYGAYV